MEYIKVLLPSICVGLIFWYVMRAVVRSDRIERREMDKFYAENAQDHPGRSVTGPEASQSAAGPGTTAPSASPEPEENAHGTRDEGCPH